MNGRILFFLLCSVSAFCQKPKIIELTQPPFSPGVERMQSFEKRKEQLKKSLVKNLPFESVGPTVFGGRISEIAVNPENPHEFYAAYASGGLWHTVNNGQSFKPLFQNEAVITTGAIAVDWKNNIIWLGTGEVNSSRSSYAGVGVFKSPDNGKTWIHSGLPESHHIGRIVLDPNDPNTAWAAVLGHLYSPNQERGIYKTNDGGKTWKRTLFVNQNTGAVDLQLDPNNSNTLYASVWERSRRAWNFTEGGTGSGLYKSVDHGENWTKLNDKNSGFPAGKNIGRIGIDLSNDSGKTVIYASLDNQNRRPKEEKDEGELEKNDFKKISVETFLELENHKLESFLRDKGFPKKYSAEVVKEKVKKEEIKPIALVEYLENANSLLFDTKVIGLEIYKSTDEGKTWTKTHEKYLDEVVYSYGYYFGFVRVHPTRPDEVYVAGVPVLKSTDGGKTFENINGKNVHVDHHDLWINPDVEGHLILGNDGGINISYDQGENWNKIVGPPVGQFYYIAADNAEPYNIYGGTQDNGVWVGPSDYKASARWQMIGKYPYESILGGDGMQIAIDSRDNSTIYTGYQFGNYFRLDRNSGKRKKITPVHDLGEEPYRWNWQTPIHLSKHNQDILYMGSNKLHRSLDKGKTWQIISKDLTSGGKKGDVPYGTLSAVHESDLEFGVIYTGSDDGKIYVTKDGGVIWDDISTGLPEKMWVARIQASSHEKSRVYLALNGYRWDNFRPLIYVSENYGKDWKKLGIDLPLETVNVIKEDPVNSNILYIGTDNGLYISTNRGTDFMAMSKNLPNAPVHDVVIQEREKELLVGTHGRSVFKADISQIQLLTDSIFEKAIYAFSIKNIKHSNSWGGGSVWFKADPPAASIPYFSDKNQGVNFKVKFEGIVLKEWESKADRGLNFEVYDLTFEESKKEKYEKLLNENSESEKPIKLKKGEIDERWYLEKGKYEIEVSAKKEKSRTYLKVK